MPTSLAKRLDVVQPSVTLAMNARAAEKRAAGIDVYAFGVGEPDFEPPAFVFEAARKAMEVKPGVSKYTAVTGIPQLKQAICARTAEIRGWHAKPSQVTVAVGAKHALFNLALSLYEPGDEVVIPAPYWVSYPEQVKLCGATPVFVETTEEAGFKMSPQAFEKALSPKTKAVILCTPSNPTGSAYHEAELKAIVDVWKTKSDSWLIVDEIYADLVYDGFKHVSAARLAPDALDRIVVVDGVSKTYAMTGWRIGWSIAPERLAKAMDKVQGQSTTNATAIAQHAAIAAITGLQDEVVKMRDAFQKRRDVMVAELSSIPGVKCRTPEGAFYAFADCRALYGIEYKGKPISNDEEAAFWMLDEANVAAVPGGAFGAPGYIRFSYATNEDRIRGGIASIKAAAERARKK
ncbi:MAG: pyridoxal phosphate-dependent aminotransferase [Labilithrix sp.]|nr:pyridoxal phosphate-dependent aminotransferase [Labilithrix sp.]MCW5811763.1 pyridoxal phosphate-dependent aminotransferase [Labilithrix sp.]